MIRLPLGIPSPFLQEIRVHKKLAERNIVITGTGLLTPLGKDVKENRLNLRLQRTGIRAFPEKLHPQTLHYSGRISSFKPPGTIPQRLRNQVRFLNRGSLLGLAAAVEAVEESRINLSDVPPERRALYIGTGDLTKVGHEFMFPATKKGSGGRFRDIDHRVLNKSSMNDVDPFFLLESMHNNLFSFLSALFGLKGPNACLATLSPSGLHALESACRCIGEYEADIALVVGSGNWASEIPHYEIDRIGLVSKCTEGVRSFRPFDKLRDGFIPGEGGAAILLEAEEIARNRNAVIFASPRGFGNCIDFPPDRGFGLPDKVGRRSIEMALDQGGHDMDDLGFINLHGSATQMGDESELRSVKAVFDGRRSSAPVCGMKPYTGHMGAASDIAEVILGMKAIKEGMVPTTLNFEETEDEFAGLSISGSHQICEKDMFLSTSYGLGGQSSSVLVKVE